ncbi:DUF7674 family protein [Lacrimispora brassicae]
MTIKYFAKNLLQFFPEYQREYQLNLKQYGEILGHVYFAEINPVLSELLKINQDKDLIRKYIDFIEDMYSDGDDDVKNVVEVTILEYLGDDETVLRNAFTYFSEDLMQASKEIEASWGRRNIRIYHKRGKALADWEWPDKYYLHSQ